jgi:hypothetical protein
MADINLSPYTAEQQAMDRRRKMAEALQQQAIAPIDMPTMPGVRVSPMQGFAKLLQSYIAGKNLRRADEEQKAYQNRSLEDMATLLADVSRQKTIPGEQLTPAVPAEITPAGSPIQENLDRKAVMAYNLNNTNQGMRLGNEGQNTFMPSSITAPQIIEARDLPSETTEDVIKTEAKPATYGEAKQVPFLSPAALSDSQYMKTDYGKQMLLQVLLQQKAQEQAAALKAQDIQRRNPEEDLYKIENGKYVVVSPGVAKEKNLIGLPNPSDFTPESLAKFQISKKYSDLVPKPKEANVPAAAQNYEYYVKQENDAGRKPLSFKDFELLKVREGRAQAAPRERVIYDANRGGTVNVDTGEFKPVTQEGQPIGAKTKDLRPVPTIINTAITQNQAVLNKINRAELLLQEKPDATGIIKSITPDILLNRVDKEGTSVRALLAELAATKVHDLSGAAVSASEFARLKPFLPQPSDDVNTLRTKLAGMKTELMDILEATSQIYSEEQGYKPLPNLAPKPVAPTNASLDAPPVTTLKEGQITTFANGQQWKLQQGKAVRVK